MTQRPTHVPKFGNWDANDHVPFTVVFENARAGKGGNKIINPNDPSENPEAFGLKRGDLSSGTEENASISSGKASGDVLKPVGSEGHPRPIPADSPRRGSGNGRAGTRVGDNQSLDQSPGRSAAYHGRLGNRPGAASPVWERKVPPEGGTMFAPATPGRSRLHPGSRGEETPDRSPALPKFGAWDEKDPASGEGFTFIFNQARNEKKSGGPVRIPALQAESPARTDEGFRQPHYAHDKFAAQKKASAWACCFYEPAVK